MKEKIFFSGDRKQNLKQLCRILVLIPVAICVLFMLNPRFWVASSISPQLNYRPYTPDSWIFKQGNRVLEPELELPFFQNLETGETYSISAELAYDGTQVPTPACFFYVDHMYCRVLLDGELLFSHTPEDTGKPDHSKSPGNVYVAAYLPQDCLGKTLEIQFIPALSSRIEYEFPTPVINDYAAQAVHTFWQDLPHNLITVLFSVLGLCSILYSTIALTGTQYREGLFIGIFAVLFSLYNITENNFDFYAISNPYYTYVLDYTTFSLIPVFLIAFLRERLDPRQRKVTMVMILADILMYLAEISLHISGIMDMREFLPVLHSVYFAEMAVVFFLLVTMKNTPRKSQLIFQMIPIIVGMLLDAAIYYLHWERLASDSTFTAIGVVIFQVVELRYVWKCGIEVYMESARSQEYRQMAYIDALSGIGNRRAYEAEKSSVASGQRKFKSLIILSVDINDLKATNDTLGHAAGDFLIRNAADVLSDVAELKGLVFRIGGDEFIAFLYNISENEFKKRLRKMEERMNAINSKSEVKLSLAVGYQLFEGEDLEGAIEEADRKMYINKAQHKAKRKQTM